MAKRKTVDEKIAEAEKRLTSQIDAVFTNLSQRADRVTGVFDNVYATNTDLDNVNKQVAGLWSELAHTDECHEKLVDLVSKRTAEIALLQEDYCQEHGHDLSRASVTIKVSEEYEPEMKYEAKCVRCGHVERRYWTLPLTRKARRWLRRHGIKL